MATETTPRGTAVILRPVHDVDPRIDMDAQSLALATRSNFPVVTQRRKRSDGLGMAAGVGVAVLLGGATFWSMSGHRAPVAAPPQVVQAPAVVGPAPVAAPPAALPMVAPMLQAPLPAPLAPAGVPGAATERLHAPAMVFDDSLGRMVQAPVAEIKPGTGKAAGDAAAAGGENEQFAARVGGGNPDMVSATAMENPSTTISQGSLIPAVLETAINTDLPGYVRAVVSRDIKAFDGTTVLIPRSSRLIGQYKSGLAAGQQRAYVIWTRLIRPDGASISLGSPAVDFSGGAGLPGQVDGHFLKRFGSAMLLSVVGGLGTLGGSSGTSVVLATGGQSAASVAASRDAQIPPTIRVRQGEPIRVFTARDLDFSTVGQWVKG